MFSRKNKTHHTGRSVTPSYYIPPPPIVPGRHKGEYAKILNTIEQFYGKGMKQHEVDCVVALMKECEQTEK